MYSVCHMPPDADRWWRNRVRPGLGEYSVPTKWEDARPYAVIKQQMPNMVGIDVEI